jgi:hypothetical protein
MECSHDPAFFEIGAKTNFSFLEGASKPEEMVLQAAILKLGGLGIADRNSVAGVVRAHAQAKAIRKNIREKKARLAGKGREGRKTFSIRSAFSRAPGWSSRTARPIFSPTRRTGRAGPSLPLLSAGNLRTIKGDCI